MTTTWRRPIVVLALALLLGAAARQSNGDQPQPRSGVTGRTAHCLEPLPDGQELVAFLAALQDSQPSGLVPIVEGSDYTTTYSNAMAAIAFVAAGELERARQVLDVFALVDEACPNPAFEGGACTCSGGFQQHRSAADGGPLAVAEDANNDFWIGDNAWLLAALQYYRDVTGEQRYDELVDHLRAWLMCLEAETPVNGIYSGYEKDGTLMQSRHPEGSIDVYGVLDGTDAGPARASIKAWLDDNVWIPVVDGCFEVGPANIPGGSRNLPTDNVSWGALALGPQYQCLLPVAERLTRRSQDPSNIEAFDRFSAGAGGYWQTDVWSHDSTIEVALSQRSYMFFNTLEITYSWTSENSWLRVFRSRDVHLKVSDEFRYSFWIKGDGSGNQLEVKLQNVTGEVFIHRIVLDFSDWRQVELRHDQFEDFFSNQDAPLAQIDLIEFAVNNASNAAAEDSQLEIARISYQDAGGTFPIPVDGFDGFESESNWLWPEGTAQMAAAYCVAGDAERWEHYSRQLAGLMTAASVGSGLPDVVTGAVNVSVPNAVASSWYLVALSCLNPFDPDS